MGGCGLHPRAGRLQPRSGLDVARRRDLKRAECCQAASRKRGRRGEKNGWKRWSLCVCCLGGNKRKRCEAILGCWAQSVRNVQEQRQVDECVGRTRGLRNLLSVLCWTAGRRLSQCFFASQATHQLFRLFLFSLSRVSIHLKKSGRGSTTLLRPHLSFLPLKLFLFSFLFAGRREV